MGDEDLERVTGEKELRVLPKDPYRKGLIKHSLSLGFVPNSSVLGGSGSEVVKPLQPRVHAQGPKAHPQVGLGKQLGEEQARGRRCPQCHERDLCARCLTRSQEPDRRNSQL